MPAKKSALLALVCLAGGCASTEGPVRSITIAANNTAVVDRGFGGTPALRSEQTHVVNVRPLNEKFWNDALAYAMPSFSVFVTNGGTQPIGLKPNDVAVFSGDRRLVLLNLADLQDRLDKAQRARPSDSAPPRNPTFSTRGAEREGPPDFKVPTRVVEDALQPQMIRPGEVGGGNIVVDAEHLVAGAPLKIVVTVAGETHTFFFDVRIQGRG